jgi:hypothetical protein
MCILEHPLELLNLECPQALSPVHRQKGIIFVIYKHPAPSIFVNDLF